MSGDHNMNQTDSAWRKRQIALDKKADNARELGLDYEPNQEQPKALRLADELPMPIFAPEAAELRRLHEVNQMLFTELQNIARANPLNWDFPLNNSESFRAWAQSRALAAIEKAGAA